MFSMAIKSCFAYGVHKLSSELNSSHRWSESWDAYSTGLHRQDAMFASACCRKYCELRFIWKRNSTLGHKVVKYLQPFGYRYLSAAILNSKIVQVIGRKLKYNL